MTRGVSVLFYLSIAALTCGMAYSVHPCQAGEPVWDCGRRTRRSFQNRLLAAGIFCILFWVSALRFDIGNDYGQYTQTAHEAYVGGYVVTEWGFNQLVRLLYWIVGGECYELVFAVFAFATLAIFLKAFARQSVSFGQTFFLFMTLGLYFQTFNTVRYYFALSVALFSMKYVLEKDYLKFVFWIVLAALFHKSVLLVLLDLARRTRRLLPDVVLLLQLRAAGQRPALLRVDRGPALQLAARQPRRPLVAGHLPAARSAAGRPPRHRALRRALRLPARRAGCSARRPAAADARHHRGLRRHR